MSGAKKLIKANLFLSAAKEYKSDLGEFLAQHHESEEIREFLLKRYSANGSTGELSVTLDKGIASFRWILPSVVDEAEALHRQAIEQAKTKSYKKAIEYWIKAISLNSQDPDYYFNVGIAFFEEKNYKESIENLEYALRLCPIYYKARVILGTLYLKIRKFDKAEYHLLESICFNPQNALAILNLGAVYSILKNYPASITAFKKTISLVPDEPRAFFGLGKIYAIQGKTEEANTCFRKVISLDQTGMLAQHAKRAMISEQSLTSADIEIKSQPEGAAQDPKYLESLYAEGYKAFLYSDYARAVAFYTKYLKSRPDDDYMWYSFAEACIRANKLQEAAKALNNCVKINKNKGIYFKQLAMVHDLLSDPENAVRNAEQALKLGKKDSVLRTILGKNYFKLNQVSSAIDVLEKAVSSNKANLTARYYLALSLIKASHNEPAIDHLYTILNSKVQTPLKAKAESVLSKLS